MLRRLICNRGCSINLSYKNQQHFKYYSTEIDKNEEILNEKLAKYNLNLSKFSKKTQERLNRLQIENLISVVKNLHDFGVEWPLIIETLENYEDYSIFDRDNMKERYEVFRKLKLSPPLLNFIIARNEQIMHLNEETISHNYKNIFRYFSNPQLDILLMKSPKLLTGDLYSFQYKFTYVYTLMNLKQDEMCTSFFFNQTIDYIRERHLFLARSGYYDRPNKKGETKIKNPSFKNIFDTKIQNYLRITTNDQFTTDEYDTFCNYLKEENFDDELLGYNIEDGMKKEIISHLISERKKSRTEASE